jgi:DNA-binding transcriptional LysR family regulator
MRELPPLNTLPAFIKVAENLSFSKAADALDVTHSAVSQHIRSLENFLGKKLFYREGHKISLTPNGKAFYHIIENAINLIADATEAQKMVENSNAFTINIPPTLMARWLIPKLSEFHKKYPKIDLRFSTLESQYLDFKKENIDFAIVYGEEKTWAEYEKQKLSHDQLVLIGNPNFFPHHYSLETLLNKTKAMYVDTDIRRLDWKKWCQKAGVKEPKKSERVIFQNTLQALQAAQAGIGLFVTHKFFIEQELRSQELKLYSEVVVSLPEAYYLIYRTEKLSQAPYKIIYQWLIK